MKLYYSKGACSLAVRILLHELKLDCEYESVSLKEKKTASGLDYLTINPKGSVPALLLDNNKVLTENAVIQQYLAETHHANHLLPPVGDFTRYQVLELLNYISTDIHKGFGPLFSPQLPEEMKKSFFIPLLKKRLLYLDQRLVGKKFLMGEQFTLADCYFFVMLFWTGIFPEIQLSEFPQLERYFAALKTREAIAAALKEEGLEA